MAETRAFNGSQNLFVPVSGLFWLRKGSKQMVQLKTEKDLAFCKDEYRDKVKGCVNSIRVARAAVSVENLGKLAFVFSSILGLVQGIFLPKSIYIL